MAVIKCLPGTKSLQDMLLYLETEGKTEDYLRSGINCTADNVEMEFDIIKELYNKPKGKQYYHITQSFSPTDNIDAKRAHDIGIRWIEDNIEDHQIYIVTHIDREHLHNHFVVNSVNLENGLKLQISPKKLEDMKYSSNNICREEGLETINMDKNFGVSKTDREYRLENRGTTTWKSIFRENIDKALKHSSSLVDFVQILRDNFDIEAEFTEKTLVYKKTDENISVRGYKLGGSYTKNGIVSRIRN